MPEPRCWSKMCSEPHRALFGRCYCIRPAGHEGLHSCGDEFALSEHAEPRPERSADHDEGGR